MLSSWFRCYGLVLVQDQECERIRAAVVSSARFRFLCCANRAPTSNALRPLNLQDFGDLFLGPLADFAEVAREGLVLED